jgi:hypothetical protein
MFFSRLKSTRVLAAAIFAGVAAVIAIGSTAAQIFPVSLTSGPGVAAPYYTSSATNVFGFEASDVEPGVLADYFICSVDGGSYYLCDDPANANYITGSESVGPLNDGVHDFCVNAVDTDGDSSDSPACVEYFIDTVAPVIYNIPEQLDPDGVWRPYTPGTWVNRIVRVRNICIDHGQLGIDSRASGIFFQNIQNWYWVQNDKELVIKAGEVGDQVMLNGTVWAGDRCEDRAGNLAQPKPLADLIVRVDRTAPKCTVSPTKVNLKNTGAWANVQFQVNISDGTLSPSAVQARLKSITTNDGSGPANWTNWNVGEAFSFSPDVQGSFKAAKNPGSYQRIYTLTWELRDRAGNLGSCQGRVVVK